MIVLAFSSKHCCSIRTAIQAASILVGPKYIPEKGRVHRKLRTPRKCQISVYTIHRGRIPHMRRPVPWLVTWRLHVHALMTKFASRGPSHTRGCTKSNFGFSFYKVWSWKLYHINIWGLIGFMLIHDTFWGGFPNSFAFVDWSLVFILKTAVERTVWFVCSWAVLDFLCLRTGDI